MGLILSTIPGFADVPDASLAHDRYALGVYLARINQNAAFGMVRLEVFSGFYANGDTVPLPVSAVDGYAYKKNEVTFIWAPSNTADPNTSTASAGAPWCLWYGIWNVDAAGLVTCAAGYRGNNDHPERQLETNDGTLHVTVVAQRQKSALVLSAVPAMTTVADAALATDKALTESLMQALNRNAKFSVVNTEVMYLGTFANGGTFARPVSPIDGYAYSDAEMKFLACWVYTAEDNAGQPRKPAISKGQLQDFSAYVTGAGPYTVNLKTKYGNGLYNDGRVAVFAFAQRATGAGLWATASAFSEIADDVFSAGASLRASKMAQLNKNTREAIGNPEIFGPTEYVNGNTVPLPTSPVDGYAYTRDECRYVWTWSNTAAAPDASASTLRLDMLRGGVDDLGNVTVDEYRYHNGASSMSLEHQGHLTVVTIAKREGHAVPVVVGPVNPPADGVEDDPAHSHDAIVHLGTAAGGANYDYRKVSTAGYTIAAGDRLEYDVWLDPSSPQFKAGIDFVTGSGRLAATGVVDQNGLACSPATDLSARANGKWYHRSMDLTALAGQTVSEWMTALEGDAAGDYVACFANLKVTNEGAIQKAVWISAASQGGIWGLVAGSVGGSGYSKVKTYSEAVYLVGSGNVVPNSTASTFTGANPLSQSGTTTTINVAAATVQFGFGQVSYSSGTVNPGSYGTFYVYADDPKYLGGAVTYLTTTNSNDLFAADGRIYFGKITTAAGGGGSGTGGGGGCPRSGAPVKLYGDPALWRKRVLPCEDFIELVTANRRGQFSREDRRYCARGLLALTSWRPGDLALTEDGEEPVLEVNELHIPGATVDSYEAVEGHVYSAWGFIGHNLKDNSTL